MPSTHDNYADLLGESVTVVSPLDIELPISFFADPSAQTVRVKTLSLRSFASEVHSVRRRTKDKLPLIKLGEFGTNVTDKGSVRSNENLLSISGVEGDIDCETVSIPEIADRLRAANIAALVYSSPRHTELRPRARVLCPVSAQQSADDRRLLFPRDDSGIVRGRLSKNRNGPCDRDIAFRIDVEELGIDDDGDPITAALVSELAPGTAPVRAKLPPSEAAAMQVLALMPLAPDGGADEKDWRAACIDGRSVSAADDRESRRKITARIVQSLVRKGVISIVAGRVFRADSVVSQFDDLEP
jgi:hypothetical protein